MSYPPRWGSGPYHPVPPAGPQFPQPSTKKKPNTLLLVLAGVGAFVVLCFGGAILMAAAGDDDSMAATAAADDRADAPSPTATGGAKPSPKSPKAPAGPGMGDPARDGKFEFVVSKVLCGKTHVGDATFGAKAQGQFCFVNIEVKNIGDEPRTLTGGDQKAFTANGDEYTNSDIAEFYANEDAAMFLTEINPGNQIKGTLIFDVPKGTKLARVELHDSMFSGGVTIELT